MCMTAKEFLKIVDETSLKSRYFEVFSDGRHDIIYGNCTVEIIDSGKSIEKIVNRLETEFGMEWRWAEYEPFPKLKPKGRYWLVWDVGSYFYSVRRNVHYEVSNQFN